LLKLFILVSVAVVWVGFPNGADAEPGEVLSYEKITDAIPSGSLFGFIDDDDQFGRGVEGIGDLDGDGVVDLAVGAMNDDDGGTNHGAVYILFLEGGTPPTVTPTPTPDEYDLLVCSRDNDSILRYDGETGNFIHVFVTAGEAGLDNPSGMEIGPDGNLYVGSSNGREVLRYDGFTGKLIDVFASGGGLDRPVGLTFGPDGNLYVSSLLTDQVLRYDGNTGAFMDVFASGGGLVRPHNGLVFGPDGNLYVNNAGGNNVLRYDGQTGAFIDVFASGMGNNNDLIFGPDGHLYVSSWDLNEVLRYDGQTGDFIDTFVAAGSGGLDKTTRITFGPDGNFYVSSINTGNVLRYNGDTGAFIDVFASGGGLSGPADPLFVLKRDSLPTPTPVSGTNNIITGGNPILDRPRPDSRDDFYLVDTNNPIDADGDITHFEVFAGTTEPVTLVIYRKTGSVFSVVGTSSQKNPIIGYNQFQLSTPITVQQGDLVGLLNNSVKFQYDPPGIANFFNLSGTVLFTDGNKGNPPSHSNATNFTGSSNRTYSVRVEGITAPTPTPTEPEPTPTPTQLSKHRRLNLRFCTCHIPNSDFVDDAF